MKIFGLDYNTTWFSSCRRALEKNGHTAKGIRAEFNRDMTLRCEKEILQEIALFKPDVFLIRNFMGILPCFLKGKKGGAYINSRLFAYLRENRIPCASWFLDDPLQSNVHLWLIKQAGGEDWLRLFCCDREFVDILKRMGIRSRFLPHCTDPDMFKILGLSPEEQERYGAPVSFVGESKVNETRERRMQLRSYVKDLAARGMDEDRVEAAFSFSIEKLMEEPLLKTEDATRTFLNEKGIALPEMTKTEARWLFSLIEWIATSERRLRLIQSLLEYDIVVYGDDLWLEVIPEKHFRGFIDYRREVVKLYNASQINLNVTRSQIRTALTQRIYDVSAAGGFLLTDYRSGFDRFFEAGSFVFYRDQNDLRERVACYLERPEERKALAKKAMNEVRRHHTYENRMETLVQMLETG